MLQFKTVSRLVGGTKGTQLFLPKGINIGQFALTSTQTTVSQTLFTAGGDDSDVLAILATSNDTATINLQVFVNNGSTDYLIGTVRIVTLSGTDGAANSIDILNSIAFAGLPINSSGKRYIPLKTGYSIKIAAVVTMTAAKTCNVVALGQDY